MASINEFGNRDKHQDNIRVRALVGLLVILYVLDATLGFNLELDRAERLALDSPNWAKADLGKGIDDEFLMRKKPGQFRILYISNSHAFTGGEITNHLQGFLDQVEPGRFEVLNIAEPGIFAPDMLQRGMRALDYDADLAIVGLNYINFSDRMRLDLQAHSARSFFNTGIFSRLHAGFWLRNYDLGLYSSTLTVRMSNLFRNRNELRNLWEQPLVSGMKAVSGDNRPLYFLEMEQDERWRFPDGYDNNLFQWNLYASGRSGHMADMSNLLAEYEASELPVIAVNMPIDFGKSVYDADPVDLGVFAKQLQTLAAGTMEFDDYQMTFPVEFSTYDALHPTWHGARLHAFNLLLKMNTHGFLGDISDAELLDLFMASDTAVSQQYRDALDGNYQPHPNPFAFRRYDPSEPDNAAELMRFLAALQPGSNLHSYMLDRLARLTRYWMEADFPIPDTSGDSPWPRAVIHEIVNARERMTYFKQAVSDFEQQRLAELAIPDISGMNPLSREQVQASGLQVEQAIYQLPEGTVVTFSSAQGEVFARGFQRSDGSVFLRTDILRDGSFIQASTPENFILPDWVRNGVPGSRWGI